VAFGCVNPVSLERWGARYTQLLLVAARARPTSLLPIMEALELTGTGLFWVLAWKGLRRLRTALRQRALARCA